MSSKNLIALVLALQPLCYQLYSELYVDCMQLGFYSQKECKLRAKNAIKPLNPNCYIKRYPEKFADFEFKKYKDEY